VITSRRLRLSGGRRSVSRRARLVAAPLAVLAALMLALAVPPPASAQPAPGIELVGQTTWVHRGERFDVRAQLTGAPADAAVRLVVHRAPGSRRDFRRTLEGELGGVLSPGTRQPIAELPAGPGGTVTAGFVAGPGGVGLPGRGVYPVEVQLVAADGSVLSSFVTYLTYLTPTDEFPPLSVAVVVDVASPLALQPDGTVVLADDALARTQERTDLLADTTGVPLTVAPSPETVEALALDGPQGVAQVAALGSDAAARPVLARPYVDIDLSALQRAGLIGEASAQAAGGANIIRSRLATEPVGGVWLWGPTLGSEAARLAVRLGLDRALVPPSVIDDGADEQPAVPTSPVRLGQGGPLAMVSDPELAGHFTDGSGVLGAHRFVAELTIEWLEAPATPRAVVVHLPPDADLDPASAAVAVNALTDGQAVQAVPLQQVFDTVPPGDGPATVTLAAHEVTADLRPIAGSLGSAHERVDGLGGLVGDPALASSLQQSLLVSTGTDTPDQQRPAYIDRVNNALSTVSGAVTLPDQFRITLTSRSSTIPIALSNLSNQNLQVQVVLDSDQLEFPDGTVIPTTLEPGTTRLEVPVRVRTSGAFTLDVTVTSPDGSIVLDTSTFDVRSTAISGVGLALSIGAGLFLLVWWGRHWRKARRSRHLMPASAHPPEPPAPLAGAGQGPIRAPIPDHEYRPAHMAGPRGR
jgi:hypothetical protein